ncbi:cation diffusion facilitator family transporter [Candidatus Woesearchaeota archaeon]|nr:cation diffusion facilitator family transporter [Candidatus Woesearchaeota archaeon]
MVKSHTKEKIAAISVVVNLILAIGKILVGWLSHSVAVLADGFHSGMDVLSSGISYIGIRIAKKPVDKNHPYGHYKFEVFSGLVITVILFLTGVWIIYEAYKGFHSPSRFILNPIALGVMLFSACLNEIMARVKIHFGKRENSLSLITDGVHSRVDVYTSVAVLVGLLLARFWIHTDSLLALLIGLYIIKESFALGKEATDSLLDVSAGEQVENMIKSIVTEEGISLAELKTQKRGSAITANLRIKLPSNLSVEEATRISNELKRKLIDNVENLEYVAIQIESHDVSSSFFKPRGMLGLGRGFGWQRRGIHKPDEETEGKGPGGYCVCPKCGYKEEHKRGIPCSTLNCPKCNTRMTRGE